MQLWQSMSWSSDGRLFHTVGPETEKARPPSFVLVLTVTADLVVDDLSQVLAESRLSERNEVPKICWTVIVKDVMH